LAFGNLGAEYFRRKQFSEAEHMIREAIRLDPNLAEAHYLLGKIYLALKRKGSAIEQYKKLQSLDARLSSKLYREIFKGKIIDAVRDMRLRER